MIRRKIVIVIPCKNEEHNIARVLTSLLKQSDCEPHIFVANDNSTDNSLGIVQQFAAQHPEVSSISINANRTRESGAGIATVVLTALKSVSLEEFDYVAKFDADLEFPPDYLSSCLRCLEANPALGLVGGVCAVQDATGEWIEERITNDDHIRGALKLYPVSVYKAIGGFAPVTGWDTIDEVKLRFRNFDILLLKHLVVKQHRPTNLETDPKVMGEKVGASLYNLRYNLFVVAISIVKRSLRKQGRLPFRALVKGYLDALSAKSKFYLSDEEAKFINKYRVSRLLDKVLSRSPRMNA